jgi:CRISPR-associated protein Cas2
MYDISDNVCRLRIAEYLEGKGWRIQESVFECNFDNEELVSVIDELEKILSPHKGNIRIYPICADCYAKAIGIGEIKENIGEKGYVIF